jgi:hypothetical protein
MNEKFDTWLRMYQFNERVLARNLHDWKLVEENEILYRYMYDNIPESHYDNINEMVYGIKRMR